MSVISLVTFVIFIAAFIFDMPSTVVEYKFFVTLFK